MTTISLPRFSPWDATWSAAVRAAPEEIPVRIPSLLASLPVPDRDDFVDEAYVEHRGEEPCTDALDEVRSRWTTRYDWGFLGFHEHGLADPILEL